LRIGINPDRKALYDRINSRAATMFDEGLVEETRQLSAKYGRDARPLTSLGYRQAMAVLAGELSLQEAVARAQQGHRNYAKRQMTWFRREPDVRWIAGFGNEEDVLRQAMLIIGEGLGAAAAAKPELQPVAAPGAQSAS
jgi:tRNA dimethylallyltransferase